MSNYQNRIVGYDNVPPDQLLANPQNWRTHPGSQTDALDGVLKQVGWVQDIIVNKTTGRVVDGHARITLALKRSEVTVPVKYVELTEAEEQLVLATLDPLSALAGTDQGQLAVLLGDISTDDTAIQQLLANLAEDAGIGAPPAISTDAPAPEEPPESSTVECPECGHHFTILLAKPEPRRRTKKS